MQSSGQPQKSSPATARDDWFTEALANTPGAFVSGSPAFAARTGLQSQPIARVIGHFPRWFPASAPTPAGLTHWLPPYYEIMQGLLSIGVPTKEDVENHVPSSKELALAETLQARLGIPFAVLTYADGGGGTEIPQLLAITDVGTSTRLVAAANLAEELNRRRDPDSVTPPQVKPINASMNDALQRWTRSMLSSEFAVTDIDALLILGKSTWLLELKRSREPWHPYVDDVPNYLLAKSVTRRSAGACDLTINYLRDLEGHAAVHALLHVARDRVVGFKKSFAHATASSCIESIREWLGTIDETYTSDNTRR
jgi:hypothetical protein